MARQYKLRLGDGTVLAVDQAALRTWLADPKALVQPAGDEGWRPLREAITEPIAVTDRSETVREVVTVGVADPTVRVRAPQTTTVTVTIAPAKR